MPHDRKKLFQNTLFLYIMIFSNQLISLLTIPYQTRVLGPVIYGKTSVAVSLMMYVQLIMDFGFLLSATEKITRYKDDLAFKNRLFTAVTICKVCLGLLVAGAIYAVCTWIPSLRLDRDLYLLYFLAYSINALVPDFIYRGQEEMRTITFRTLFIRVFFASLMLIFVTEQSHYLRLPILLFLGNLLAVLFSFWHVQRRFGIHFVIPGHTFTKQTVLDSAPFFLSRIATTFYQALIGMILGVRFVGQAVVGYYGASDKILGLVKSVSSPVADSLYPHMVRTKDYSLIRKILLVTCPVILLCAVVAYFQAEWICVLMFGEEYRPAAGVLRCMVPAMMVVLPTYILSFPALAPIGLSRYANISNLIGCVTMLVLLGILYLCNYVNVFSLCIAGSIAEVSVLAFRAVIVWKFRDRMKSGA